MHSTARLEVHATRSVVDQAGKLAAEAYVEIRLDPAMARLTPDEARRFVGAVNVAIDSAERYQKIDN